VLPLVRASPARQSNAASTRPEAVASFAKELL